MAPVSQQSWTRKEICRVLSLEERQLRNWERQGLISASETYEFTDLLKLRTVNSLCEKKIPLRHIRESFVRRMLWVVPLFFVVSFKFAQFNELRIYGEMLPLVVLGLACSVEGWRAQRSPVLAQRAL